MRALLGIAPLVVASSAAIAQSSVPTRTLAKPEFEYAEPFSQLAGLRELRDGRVIVADMRDKSLQAVDLATGRATPIGREGAGPGEWSLPMRVFPFLGDSSLVYDIGNMRYLVVAPDATPARTFNPVADAADGGTRVMRGNAGGAGTAGGAGGAAGGRAGAGAGGTGGGRADGGGRAGGGGRGIRMGGGMMMGAAGGTDSRGRLYSLGSAIKLDERTGTISSADSAPVLRLDLGSNRTDTVAYVNLAKNAASGQASSVGGRQEMRIQVGGSGPYAAADAWTVLPDGRVAIARVNDYHLELVDPSGRRVVGQPVRYTPVRVDEGEKQAWRDAQQSGQRVAVSIGDGGGRSVSAPAAGPVREPDAWPATLPPFSQNSVLAAPNGETWIVRNRAASDNVPTADVFNAQAQLVGRVALPPRTRIVGFGSRGVYLVRIDDDDLQYLQRHAMTWTGCPPELRENCR